MNFIKNNFTYALLGLAIALLLKNYAPFKAVWLEAGAMFGIAGFLWNRLETRFNKIESSVARFSDHLTLHTAKFAHEGMEADFRKLQEKVMIIEAEQQFGEDFRELREQVQQFIKQQSK